MSLYYDCNDVTVRNGALSSATHCVQSGQLVVLPTDTVYGIGADAFDSTAVADLLAAKGRGRDMPVPVLVGSWSTIEGLSSMVSTRTWDLVEAFWPGGLTLIVEQAPSLTWDLGDARGTVAVRMPLHPVAIELLERTGPMAVSSANRPGTARAHRPAGAGATRRRRRGLPRRRPRAHGGVASTIVDVTGECRTSCATARSPLDELRAVVPEIR